MFQFRPRPLPVRLCIGCAGRRVGAGERKALDARLRQRDRGHRHRPVFRRQRHPFVGAHRLFRSGRVRLLMVFALVRAQADFVAEPAGVHSGGRVAAAGRAGSGGAGGDAGGSAHRSRTGAFARHVGGDCQLRVFGDRLPDFCRGQGLDERQAVALRPADGRPDMAAAVGGTGGGDAGGVRVQEQRDGPQSGSPPGQ